MEDHRWIAGHEYRFDFFDEYAFSYFWGVNKMFNEGSGMKEKLLEKLLELFSGLPDKEEESLESPEGEGKAVEIIGVGAKPLGKDDKKVC